MHAEEIVEMKSRVSMLELLMVQVLGSVLTEDQLKTYYKHIPWHCAGKCQLGNAGLLQFKEQRVCGTCHYFGPCLEEDPISGGRGSKNTTFHKCTVIEHDSYFDPVQGEGAVVQDGSGYHAKLCVEAEFACIKWQKKQTEILHHAV
jgi:hypothetical protein